MNNRTRFRQIMDFQAVDHIPAWYFGTWDETRTRWTQENGGTLDDIPALTGMDPDLEAGMWEIHGLARTGVIPSGKRTVLEETADYRIVRTALGAVLKEGKHGSSIPQHLEEALKPTRESWNAFRRMLDPSDPARQVPGWEAKATALNQRDRMTCFLGSCLYGAPREWMGVEAISYLPYDDPALYEEIIETVCDHYLTLLKPVLEKTQFDFAYFFEDCCFNTGPLFSPEIYRRFYHKYYRRMVDFYHAMGVRYVLLDSDGKVDDRIPCWLDSGIDILFPVEVGTWKANPAELRRKFGPSLRMMGGVDKLVIPHGEAAIRAHLESLKPAADQGGYLPLPDHRIPPDCSLEQFRTYVRVFKDVFGNPDAQQTTP
ncbi:MAG: uroporphyrinogen decarboxylase family protein [bacterium]